MIGFISEKFESGNRGPGTIADTPGDPGGKSYGVYQLSSEKGTLRDYLKQSVFREDLDLFPIAEKDFDLCWSSIAEKYPYEFRLDQHNYIVRTHYLPRSVIAKRNGFLTENTRVKEALFSISVQHGGAAQIINSAAGGLDSFSQVTALYRARVGYVKNLKLPNQIEASLMARYEKELLAVLQLSD